MELAFERLKSLLDLDALRTHRNSLLGEVWILGKLLYALVIERRIQRQSTWNWDRLNQPRQVTPWRFLAIARRQVDAWILEVHRWRQDHWAMCLDVITERPRRRRLQTLPAAVIKFLGTPGNQLVA